MSLEFVMIPSSKEYENDANALIEKLKTDITKSVEFEFDNNYQMKLNSRVGRHRKADKDIIVIDNNYKEKDLLTIWFSDKGSRMQKMDVDEFTTLLNEFIDGDNISDNDIVNNDDKTDDSCRIM
jgi:putative IMPACT (imprinted ancient) family translation regulator